MEVGGVGWGHGGHALDLFGGEGLNRLLGITDERKATNATAIREGDVPAIWFHLPARLLVLDTSVIVLKLGIALLAWLVLFTMLIEPLNSEPGTVRAGLTGLRVERVGKREFTSQDTTKGLQVIFADAPFILPPPPPLF